LPGKCFAGYFAWFAAGCSVQHGALAPASPEAAEVGRLFRLFTWVSVLIFLVVVVAASVAIGRGLLRRRPSSELLRDEPLERRLRRAVTASTVVSVLILVGLLVASVASCTSKSPHTSGGGRSAIRTIAPITWSSRRTSYTSLLAIPSR
jgi:heme/copper-type cytochrome/quinol oxidase subunit 2